MIVINIITIIIVLDLVKKVSKHPKSRQNVSRKSQMTYSGIVMEKKRQWR